MARELFISLYLALFNVFFRLFKKTPQKKKTVFVASFGDNIMYVKNALETQYDGEIVVLKTPSCRAEFSESANVTTLQFDMKKKPIQFIKSIFHLATCNYVFVDNYFGFLAASPFKSNVKCIQLWHAAGAVKRFGLKDPSIESRSTRAHERFKKVYDKFDHVVVGSEKMTSIFKESFGLDEERILRSGVPRTDFFYEMNHHQKIEQNLVEQYPVIQDKKVILYAPTFRDHQLTDPEIQLNLKQLYDALHEDYVLMLRMHPAVNALYDNEFPDFIIDVSSYKNINELLVISDLLITDYSSIPYEYSLLERPMIFYSYDIEEYSRARGFWEDYHSTVPGPVAYTTEEIIEIIEVNAFDMNIVRSFAEDWNEYSKGNASRQLINHIYGKEEVETPSVVV